MDGADLWDWATIGIIAGSVGIVAWAGTVYRRARARWQRHHTLRQVLEDVEARNHDLVSTAVRLSRVLIDGITWSGWRIPAPEMTTHLDDLAAIDQSLERLHARTRGLRAEPAVERLRDDIERAVTTIRRGVELYRQGTWATYRTALNEDPPRTFLIDAASGKRKYQPSAAGEEPVPALHSGEGVDEVHRLQRDLNLFVRSCWHQLGEDQRAATFNAGWPERSYELFGPPLNAIT